MNSVLRTTEDQPHPRYRVHDCIGRAELEKQRKLDEDYKTKTLAKKYANYSHNTNVYKGKNLSDHTNINPTVERHLNPAPHVANPLDQLSKDKLSP